MCDISTSESLLSDAYLRDYGVVEAVPGVVDGVQRVGGVVAPGRCPGVTDAAVQLKLLASLQ